MVPRTFAFAMCHVSLALVNAVAAPDGSRASCTLTSAPVFALVTVASSVFQSASLTVKSEGGSALPKISTLIDGPVIASRYASPTAPPFHITSGPPSPVGKTVLSYGYRIDFTDGSAPLAARNAPIVAALVGEVAGFMSMTSCKFTVIVAVAVNVPTVAVTIATPPSVPDAVTRPLAASTEAMSGLSTVQLAATDVFVPSLNVAIACSAWFGGFVGSVTVSFAVDGVIASAVGVAEEASKCSAESAIEPSFTVVASPAPPSLAKLEEPLEVLQALASEAMRNADA
jgi:hypothetical protein